MMYLRYLTFLPMLLFCYLLTWLLAPFLAAFSVIFNYPNLPGYLAYFHTNDDDLDGGQHQLGWPKVKGVKLWIQRMSWLFRNPAYGFAAFVFGFSTVGMKVLEQTSKGTDGDKTWENTKTNSVWFLMQAANGKKYFSYRRDQHLFGARYIKIWFGWNYMAYDKKNHMMKAMVNPFRSAK